MVSRLDLQKRRQWEARYKRFRASGLIVEQFCEREGVSVSMFYYWAKRVQVPATSSSPTTVAIGNTDAAFVRFRWNATAEALVPADCLDAIRCLAECLKHVPAERSDAFQKSAFQEAVVRS